MNEKKKSLEKFMQIFSLLFFSGFGFFSAYYQIHYFPNQGLRFFIYPLLIIFVNIPLHVILHEIGHLIAGFLSGYRFTLFRLGSYVWINTPSGLSKRKQYLPGILGQALMVPPKTASEERPPMIFYHMGGLLINALTIIIFIFVAQLSPEPFIRYFLYLSSLIGFYLLLMNALPIPGTDGFHILRSLRDPSTNDELITLLNLHHKIVNGHSFSSLADEIEQKKQPDFKNPNTASFHSITAAAYLEQLDFQKASEIYAPFWEHRELLFPAHQAELSMSYFFSLLVTNPDHPDVHQIKQSPFYKTFQKMKSADSYRVLAAEALYLEDNPKKAQHLLTLGEKKISLSPNLSDEHLEEKLYAFLKQSLNDE